MSPLWELENCDKNAFSWQQCYCRMVDTVVEQLGGLHIAVNNAGMNKNHAGEDCTEEDWDNTFELNTKGVFLCCQVTSTDMSVYAVQHFVLIKMTNCSFQVDPWPLVESSDGKQLVCSTSEVHGLKALHFVTMRP